MFWVILHYCFWHNSDYKRLCSFDGFSERLQRKAIHFNWQCLFNLINISFNLKYPQNCIQSDSDSKIKAYSSYFLTNFKGESLLQGSLVQQSFFFWLFVLFYFLNTQKTKTKTKSCSSLVLRWPWIPPSALEVELVTISWLWTLCCGEIWDRRWESERTRRRRRGGGGRSCSYGSHVWVPAECEGAGRRRDHMTVGRRRNSGDLYSYSWWELELQWTPKTFSIHSAAQLTSMLTSLAVAFRW